LVGTWLVLMTIVLVQVPIIVRRKQWAELRLFIFLWLIAAVYSTLVAAAVPIPTVTGLIMRATERIFGP